MEKKIRTRISYDFKTMKHYNYYNLTYRRKGKIVYLVLMGLGIAGVIAMVLLKVLNDSGGWLMPIVLAVFAAYLGFNFFNFEKKLDDQIATFFTRNPRVFTKELEIDNEDIKIFDVGATEEDQTIGWEYVTEIHDTLEYYFLIVGKNPPLIISKADDDFVSGSLTELEEIVREKAAAKPYKRIETEIVKREITFVHPPEAYEAEELSDVEELTDFEVVDEETEEMEHEQELQSEESVDNDEKTADLQTDSDTEE